MTTLYVLDTDQISLFQRSHLRVRENITRINPLERAVTIISVAEQFQGRLAAVRRASSEAEVIVRLEQLRETLIFYLNTQVLPYDEAAQTIYEQLKKQKIRIGTQDLRIAAITLSRGATLVTRNRRDFVQVPKLTVVDWSV
jgi:tRNA(fMet)-specific endonuclease VapC